MAAIGLYPLFPIWNTIREAAISIIPKFTMPAILFAVPKKRTTHAKRVNLIFF
jgi:hypothetical protein